MYMEKSKHLFCQNIELQFMKTSNCFDDGKEKFVQHQKNTQRELLLDQKSLY
jgi:hypothetical protein